MAAEAAHLVAQRSIERGEIERALWATAQGLGAAPGDAVLYRDRMQAHERAGNLAGVESVMKELRGIVDDCSWVVRNERPGYSATDRETTNVPRLALR